VGATPVVYRPSTATGVLTPPPPSLPTTFVFSTMQVWYFTCSKPRRITFLLSHPRMATVGLRLLGGASSPRHRRIESDDNGITTPIPCELHRVAVTSGDRGGKGEHRAQNKNARSCFCNFQKPPIATTSPKDLALVCSFIWSVYCAALVHWYTGSMNSNHETMGLTNY
jgi:hypothetical protein